jgi:hypothetical protein
MRAPVPDVRRSFDRRPGGSHATTRAVRLRPLRLEDEAVARRAHEELDADDFVFCLPLEPGMSWTAYLDALDADRRGVRFPDGVAATFLVAEAEGTIVSPSSIRHSLNAFLERQGRESPRLAVGRVRSRLIDAIAADPTRPYYESWATALESLVLDLGPTKTEAIGAAAPLERPPL